jgi:hypothetical protein
MDIVTNFDGWKPEDIIHYCHQVLGVKERTHEEWEEYYREEKAKEERQQECLKEKYETGNLHYYPVYKKSCPVCGKVFYTYNERRIYDD